MVKTQRSCCGQQGPIRSKEARPSFLWRWEVKEGAEKFNRYFFLKSRAVFDEVSLGYGSAGALHMILI